jgi:hypothetical protein
MTLHITILPRRGGGGHRLGTPLVRAAAATGLSVMDLDDVRIVIREFKLDNKFSHPWEVLNMISSAFYKQVWHPSAKQVQLLVLYVCTCQATHAVYTARMLAVISESSCNPGNCDYLYS